MTRTPLQTHRWHPPRDLGRQGPFAPNALLASLELMPIPGSGAEDVAVDAEGRIYTGTREGYLLRLSPDGRHVERIAQTGGRPLGIEVHPDGSLVVCDAHRGLLRIDTSTGDITELVTTVARRPMRFTNNCAVAKDGTMHGPNFHLLKDVCKATSRPIIASGGIARLEDLHKLADMVSHGIEGAIIGRALYDGAFTLAEASVATEARYDPYEWGPARP